MAAEEPRGLRPRPPPVERAPSLVDAAVPGEKRKALSPLDFETQSLDDGGVKVIINKTQFRIPGPVLQKNFRNGMWARAPLYVLDAMTAANVKKEFTLIESSEHYPVGRGVVSIEEVGRQLVPLVSYGGHTDLAVLTKQRDVIAFGGSLEAVFVSEVYEWGAHWASDVELPMGHRKTFLDAYGGLLAPSPHKAASKVYSGNVRAIIAWFCVNAFINVLNL